MKGLALSILVTHNVTSDADEIISCNDTIILELQNIMQRYILIF